MYAKTVEEKTEMQSVPYGELVGSLNWISTNSRPDISTSVGILCRFISNPGRQHWKSAQRVLPDLAGTKYLGIQFTKQIEQDQFFAYSDAD